MSIEINANSLESRLLKIKKVAKLLNVSVSGIIALKKECYELINLIESECKYTFYSSGTVVKHSISKENFGLFSDIAYKLDVLTPFDEWSERRMFISEPVLIDGKPIISYADEGKTEVLCRCRLTDRKTGIPKWHLVFHSRGWIHKKELALTSSEILNNIAEEVDHGSTVLSGGKPGWY